MNRAQRRSPCSTARRPPAPPRARSVSVQLVPFGRLPLIRLSSARAFSAHSRAPSSSKIASACCSASRAAASAACLRTTPTEQRAPARTDTEVRPARQATRSKASKAAARSPSAAASWPRQRARRQRPSAPGPLREFCSYGSREARARSSSRGRRASRSRRPGWSGRDRWPQLIEAAPAARRDICRLPEFPSASSRRPSTPRHEQAEHLVPSPRLRQALLGRGPRLVHETEIRLDQGLHAALQPPLFANRICSPRPHASLASSSASCQFPANHSRMLRYHRTWVRVCSSPRATVSLLQNREHRSRLLEPALADAKPRQPKAADWSE